MQPNILFILTDQHTYSTLSAYGASQCETPHLDALSEKAWIYNKAYSVSPICTPTRASLQTGVYPSKHGMVTNIYSKGTMVHELPDDEALLSRRLLAQGYSVGYTGKWHLGAGKDPKNLGGVEYPFITKTMKFSGLPSDVGYEGDDFPGHGGIGDRYASFHDYLKAKGKTYAFKMIHEPYPKAAEITSGADTTVPHYLVDRTIGHLKNFKKRTNPFFYMLNFWQPHEPYYVPTEFLDRYREMNIQPWTTYHQDTKGLPMIHNVQRNLGGNWEKVQEFVRCYYAAITHIDHEIGRLIQYLKEDGLYNNTVIIFSSDHGETLGVHAGLSDKGLDMYEETVHVPLLIRYPQKTPQRFDQLVHTCDIYSTILDIAGVQREVAERDGQSLLRLFEDASWREYLVSESSGLDFMSYTQRMIRDETFKFVFHVGEVDELYHLNDDPFEQHNLVHQPEYASTCIRFLEKLKEWLIANNDGLIVRYGPIYDAKISHYHNLH